MPVTFPDGTTAELVYTAGLKLEELSVNPDAFAEGGPSACGSPVYATRYDPHGGWIRGDAPLAEHVTQDGSVVALWEGTWSNEPWNYVVHQFGSWSVLVRCQGRSDLDFSVLAEHLHGFETSEGLLVLEGTPPLVLHPYGGHSGPTLRLSSSDIVVDLQPHSDLCDPATGWDGDIWGAGDGVVQWCLQPRGSAWLYANSFSADGEKLLERLVSELEIRKVEPTAS
jgi:hypothetical protein